MNGTNNSIKDDLGQPYFLLHLPSPFKERRVSRSEKNGGWQINPKYNFFYMFFFLCLRYGQLMCCYSKTKMSVN